MSYIGKTPTVGNFIKLDAITTSSTNSYTLQHNSVNFSPESANHMLVSLNGVIQAPNTSYTVSGSTITFLPTSGTLSSSDSIDFIMVYGNILDLGVASSVTDSSITKGKLNLISDSSSAGLTVKGDGSSENGTIQLNCSQNTHGVKVSSPAHSSGQSYEMILPTTNITAGKFLKVDSVSGSGATGIGQLSFADAGGITEYDQWRVTADFSGDVDPITSNLERVDSYNWEKIGTGMTESSGVFTFPSTGKYWIFLNAMSRNPSSSGERNHSFSLSISTDTGSNFNTPVGISNNISYHSSSVANQQSVSGHYLFDVTNTSTHQVRFGVTALGNDATVVEGDTDQSKTYFTFIKVGET